MKITILQGAFLPVPPVLGGAVEKRWFALGREFARRGHEVVHISRKYKGSPDEEWISGVLHKRVQGYNWPSSALLMKWMDLRYSLRARSVIPIDSDIVITNTFWAPLFISSAMQKRCMVDVARMPKGQMRLYSGVARLRANSSSVAEAILQELPQKEAERVVLVPNPLPFQHMPESDFKAKKPVLLYAGRIHPEKGLDLLLKAVKKLGTDWRLRIVGTWDIHSGGGGEAYLHRLKDLAGEDKVEFCGPVNDIDALNRCYAEASIFVYPSIAEKGETFGLAPLEAMAWGCVPLVSDIACFKDFIHHRKNGWVFDHRDPAAVELLSTSIAGLQKDKALREKMGREALKVRQSHSTAVIASRFLEEFELMLSERSILKPLSI